MRTITITDESYRAMVADAMPHFHQTGIRKSNGTWEVPIEEDTWRALQQLRLRNESESDVLQRINRRRLAASARWLPWPAERLRS